MSRWNYNGEPHYSDENSTTTPLANGESFTGAWEDAELFHDVMVALSTDQDCTYSVQFSPDGINQDSTLTRYYRTNQINVPHRFTMTRRYCRIVVTNNSGTDQTYLRLQTAFSGGRHPLNVPLDGTVAQDYDATVVRPTDYHYEVAEGLRQGHRTFNKFGFNLDVDSGAAETIWAPGGLYTPPTTASTLTAVSSLAADTNGSTGAHGVYIQGIDANRKYQEEVIFLSGVTPVVTTTTWLGINRASVFRAGSGQTNAGNITITATTGGATLAYLPAGGGVTQQCIYHVQLQSTALADWLWINVNKIAPGTAPIVTITGVVFNPTSNCNYEVYRLNLDTSVENTIALNPEQPFVLSPGDVFQLQASTNTNDTIVTARFSLIEIQQADYDPNS